MGKQAGSIPAPDTHARTNRVSAQPTEGNHTMSASNDIQTWLSENPGSYGITLIAEKTGVSRSTVARAISRMLKAGYVVGNNGLYAAPATEDTPYLTAKVGTRWTYVYAGGSLIAELRNDQINAVESYLGH